VNATRPRALRAPRERPILVVDDDPASRKLLGIVLRAEHHHVEEADSAESALAWLATGTPNLVVVDLLLPGMSGVALIRRLRSAPATRDIPIVVVTSTDADGEESQHALAAGAAACCTKPIATEAFGRLVSGILEAADRPPSRSR
jgi:CheY-like chemotaxis protein